MRLSPALFLLCLAAATPGHAAPVTLISPIYSQLVALPVPDPFVPGYEHAQGASYIMELAPKGESVEQWSQLITLTGAKGLAARASVQDVAGQLAQGYAGACPDSFASKALPLPEVKGAKAAFAGYLSCGSYQGQSESMVVLVLQGAEEIYTVQWAAHGPESATPLAVDAEVWSPRLAALAKVRICDKVAGEAAPYPSCTE